MSDMRFFGTYATCRSENKKLGAHLIGPDNIVGNDVTLDFRVDDGITKIWAVNKFGTDIGYFDSQTSYLLNVIRGRGWEIHAQLSMIGLTDYVEGSGADDINTKRSIDNGDDYINVTNIKHDRDNGDTKNNVVSSKEVSDGFYWAEVALFAFSPRYNDYAQTFGKLLSEKLALGVRPEIDIPTSSIDSLIENKGDYLSDKKRPSPSKKKGTVIVKKSRKPSESAIEAGRRGNKGCYFISYLFIAIVILLIALGVKTLLGW